MWKDRLGNIPELLQEKGLFSRVVRAYNSEKIAYEPYKGIIITGGTPNISEIRNYPFLNDVISFTKQAVVQDLPILGICLGHQILAAAIGGTVEKAAKPEAGFIRVSHSGRWLFKGLDNPLVTFQYHFDEVTKLPEGTETFAWSENTRIQAFKVAGRPVIGVQFHPEIGRERGIQIISDRREMLESRRIDTGRTLGPNQEPYNEKMANLVVSRYINSLATINEHRKNKV